MFSEPMQEKGISLPPERSRRNANASLLRFGGHCEGAYHGCDLEGTHQMPSSSKQRILETPHGALRVPAFLPDATRGAVRSASSEDLRSAGVQGLVVNVFHLGQQPGTGVIAAMGGIHRFMNWDRPILSDSGGFQVYSLLKDSPQMGGITRGGFHYRHEKGSPRKLLTPRKSIERQVRMVSDILVCLDHCTHGDDPPEVQTESVENTICWARECKTAFQRATADVPEPPILFAVVQGGTDRDLRTRCVEELLEIGFDGLAFGGWPVTPDGRLQDAVAAVAEIIPKELPKWALGVGKPEHLVTAAGLGYDLFDCVLPTRDARHNRLYVFRDDPETSDLVGDGFYEFIRIQDEKYLRDAGPVGPHCDCACCRNYSRGYLHHLFHVRESLAYRLATIHNLRFYTRLMELLRRGS